MTEGNPAPTPHEQNASSRSPEPSAQPPSKPIKRRRRWPWIIGVVVLVLLILVLLTPTIASMGWARAIIVGQINNRLDGHVEIKDWSLGWWSPIRVDGIVVFDGSNRQILQLPHLSTGLTLWDAARGRYHLGKIEVNGLDVLVSRQRDGSLNWERLGKSGSKPGAKSEQSGSSSLPDIDGEVVLKNCSVTCEDASGATPPVWLRPIQADIKIPGINQTISDSLSVDVQARSPSAPKGRISLTGTLAAVKNNNVDVSAAAIDQTLDATGIDLATLSAFLGSSTSVALDGQSDAHAVIHLSNGANSSIEARNNLALQIKNLSIVEGAGARARKIVDGDLIHVVIGGILNSGSQGRVLHVDQLDAGDSQGVFSFKKAGGDLAIDLPASGAAVAKGSVQIAADLKRLNDIAQALQSPAITAQSGNGMGLGSGKLQGEISLAQAGVNQIKLSGNLAISNLALKRGPASVDAGTVSLASIAAITSAPSSSASSVLDQVQELQLTQLHITAPTLGGADISLVEPIDVKDPGRLAQLLTPSAGAAGNAGGASMSGRILLRGNPGPLLAFNDVLAGQTPTHQIAGGYAVDEQFNTDANGTILARGRADLNDLSVDGQAYPEKAFRLLNELSLQAPSRVLDIKTLTAQASGSNAFNLNVKGRITDLGGAQKIDNILAADLDYDAAGLWKLLLPLMSRQSQQNLRDAQAAGKYHKRFEVTGAYPSGQPFAAAVQKLAAHGDLQLDLFQGAGVTVKQLEIPILLKDGIAQTAEEGKPSGEGAPPASFNNGTLDLAGCSVDLRHDHLLLTTPHNQPLVQNAALNPVLATWLLGSLLNNPLFAGADQATGLLSVTVVNCDQVPLDSSLTGPEDGDATLNVSVQGLQVGNPFLQRIAGAARLNLSSLRGDVQKYQVRINRGMTAQDLTMTFGQNQRPLRLFGQVRMADGQMMPMTLDLPWKLLGLHGIDKSVSQFLPDGIEIPLTGTVDKPQFAIDFNKLFSDAVKKSFLGGLGNQGTTRPSGDNPLQQLQDLLGGKRDTNKK